MSCGGEKFDSTHEQCPECGEEMVGSTETEKLVVPLSGDPLLQTQYSMKQQVAKEQFLLTSSVIFIIVNER